MANKGSPYQEQQNREIKALSDLEVAGYLTGKGMGYAKAAELNNYPGPRHVLDLANELNLSQEQTRQSRALLDDTQTHAGQLGEQLVAKERELNQLFADSMIDDDNLARLLTEISILQTKIRYVHLRAHLQQKAVLNQQQLQRYQQLRGYDRQQPNQPHHMH
ncbi:periplasmic heavy metal sensor [Methylophaga sp. OBS4]|nr:periplasmic heavy metal sensor [Methylophaga sp. OBS4]